MAAPESSQPWALDVSSLMILIGENEEMSYRLSQRSFLQCIAAAPVTGLQNYLSSYDVLADPSTIFEYFSPYGCKTAPFRNISLTNAIRHAKLLEDGKFTVFRVPPRSKFSAKRNRNNTIDMGKYQNLLVAWVSFTWLALGGILAFTILLPDATWIGLANVVALTGWSIILRLIEYFNVRPANLSSENIHEPDAPDAIFIMGRANSAFVLEGTRKDIKEWTSPGLVYNQGSLLGLPASIWQGFTRVGSLAQLIFIFCSIPNGSTTDQLAFIMLCALSQLNVVVGQQLNSRCRLAQLEKLVNSREETRTHVYAKLIRRFRDVQRENNWIETEAWDEWKARVLDAKDDHGVDFKKLFSTVSWEVKNNRASVEK
ncbi:hypothetical protein V8F06_012283 [Rhypophila decipiens]